MRTKAWMIAVASLATLAAAQDAPAPTPDDSEIVSAETPAEVISDARREWHIADLEASRERASDSARRADEAGDITTAKNMNRVVDLLDSIRRPNQVRLSLNEALRRALANNYVIEIAGFNPAIETTRVVEAQAAFDGVFFTNLTKNNVDRPSGSQLTSTDLDSLDLSAGVRKLLITGTQVQASYELGRTKTNLAFQQINPEYTTNFVFLMNQPLLRGFGIDHNRSFIVLRQNDRRISRLAFRRQVRDVLRQTEEAYWRLAQARRNVVISARLLADFEQILQYLEARRHFDIIPVQLAATQADLEETRVRFLVATRDVRNQEDQLIALMNADDVDLADDIEIIPTDFPQPIRLDVNRLAAIETALEHRSELKDQQLRVENARIAMAQARNAELPRLDFTFRQSIDGLGGTADSAFDEATRVNFIEYLFGIEFELPIGNRGPRAAHHRARLAHAQAAAALKQQYEEVILEVNTAARQLDTAYAAILPSFHSAEAREREVDSIVARAERRDFLVLNNELGARRQLAEARRGMLSAYIEYGIAVTNLEYAQGTLLPYNNVVIPTDDADPP